MQAMIEIWKNIFEFTVVSVENMTADWSQFCEVRDQDSSEKEVLILKRILWPSTDFVSKTHYDNFNIFFHVLMLILTERVHKISCKKAYHKENDITNFKTLKLFNNSSIWMKNIFWK